jgi:dTDP-4-amino-4,6-dideoxygalactose transaminase
LTVSDADVAARARRLRNGGQTEKYHHAEFGVNSRLDEVQAAVLRARLTFLPGWTAARRTLAAAYRRALDGVSSIAVPRECDPGHVYHLFPVLNAARNDLQAHLRTRGVETLIHYPIPLPRQPAFATERPQHCPIADRICDQVLSLPLYPALDAAAIDAVAAAVRAFPVESTIRS